jgi:hypothetical protein
MFVLFDSQGGLVLAKKTCNLNLYKIMLRVEIFLSLMACGAYACMPKLTTILDYFNFTFKKIQFNLLLNTTEGGKLFIPLVDACMLVLIILD